MPARDALRRLLRRYRRRLPVAVVVAVALLAVCLRLLPQAKPAADSVFDSPGPFRVERVVDGDTLRLEGGTRVRLIGVDTPETKHPRRPVEPLGIEAANFVRRHIEGRHVTLRFDRERRDRYRRVLAYVYVDKWFLNEELIRAGYSRAVTRFPYSSRMKKRFREAEAEARKNHRGLWQQPR
jgi:micrococcal nuclease